MLDKVLAHIGNVNEAVFVDTDVHEGTEIHDIADYTFQLLTNLQILEVQNILTKDRGCKVIPQIPARFEKVCQNVFEGFLAQTQLFSRFCYLNRPQAGLGLLIQDSNTQYLKEFLHSPIGLWVDTRIVQEIGPIWNPQKASSLLKGLVSQARYFFQLLPSFQRSLFFPILDNIFRDGLVETSDMRKKGGTGSIDIDPDLVDHCIDDKVQSF